jgi:hypothetical protein
MQPWSSWLIFGGKPIYTAHASNDVGDGEDSSDSGDIGESTISIERYSAAQQSES